MLITNFAIIFVEVSQQLLIFLSMLFNLQHNNISSISKTFHQHTVITSSILPGKGRREDTCPPSSGWRNLLLPCFKSLWTSHCKCLIANSVWAMWKRSKWAVDFFFREPFSWSWKGHYLFGFQPAGIKNFQLCFARTETTAFRPDGEGTRPVWVLPARFTLIAPVEFAQIFVYCGEISRDFFRCFNRVDPSPDASPLLGTPRA